MRKSPGMYYCHPINCRPQHKTSVIELKHRLIVQGRSLCPFLPRSPTSARSPSGLPGWMGLPMFRSTPGRCYRSCRGQRHKCRRHSSGRRDRRSVDDRWCIKSLDYKSSSVSVLKAPYQVLLRNFAPMPARTFYTSLGTLGESFPIQQEKIG